MKYFMSGTPLASMERQMMEIPRFRPRHSGTQAEKDYTYTAEDLDCKYCERRKHGKCTSEKCPWMLERMQAGVINYEDVVKSCFAEKPKRRLLARIKYSYADGTGSQYRSMGHQDRMIACLHDFREAFPAGEPDPVWLAVVFLLTASDRLWDSCAKAVTLMSIDLRSVPQQIHSTQDYALLQMAKSLLDRKQRISAFELADKTLIRDGTFTVLMDAMVLAEYGVALLPAEKKEALE